MLIRAQATYSRSAFLRMVFATSGAARTDAIFIALHPIRQLRFEGGRCVSTLGIAYKFLPVPGSKSPLLRSTRLVLQFEEPGTFFFAHVMGHSSTDVLEFTFVVRGHRWEFLQQRHLHFKRRLLGISRPSVPLLAHLSESWIDHGFFRDRMAGENNDELLVS